MANLTTRKRHSLALTPRQGRWRRCLVLTKNSAAVTDLVIVWTTLGLECTTEDRALYRIEDRRGRPEDHARLQAALDAKGWEIRFLEDCEPGEPAYVILDALSAPSGTRRARRTMRRAKRMESTLPILRDLMRAERADYARLRSLEIRGNPRAPSLWSVRSARVRAS